jgi:hypothetical protein
MSELFNGALFVARFSAITKKMAINEQVKGRLLDLLPSSQC